MTGSGGRATRGTVGEIALLFTRLSVTAFGGPAAHVAMMRDEIVRRRRWVSDQEFLDLVGVTNIIPGPSSTELAIHLGRVRAGGAGLLTAGACFIVPAAAIVLGLAVLYERYGVTPGGQDLLYAVKPVVLAIVAAALAGLLRTAARTPPLALLAAAATVAALGGVDEVLLLAAAGLVAALATTVSTSRRRAPPPAALVPVLILASAAAPVALERLFWVFLKIGALLFGSGYVLLAFLRTDLVTRTGWLTDQQLLDAVAVGQLTPGPLFTTATFVGHLLAGLPGALVATVGIFLPSFVFVAATGRVVRWVRGSPRAGAALDGINAASLGLMTAVGVHLGRDALVDPLAAVIALTALVALLRWRVNSAWLVLAGLTIGAVRLAAVSG